MWSVSSLTGRSQLWSAAAGQLVVPFSKTKTLGDKGLLSLVPRHGRVWLQSSMIEPCLCCFSKRIWKRFVSNSMSHHAVYDVSFIVYYLIVGRSANLFIALSWWLAIRKYIFNNYNYYNYNNSYNVAHTYMIVSHNTNINYSRILFCLHDFVLKQWNKVLKKISLHFQRLQIVRMDDF